MSMEKQFSMEKKNVAPIMVQRLLLKVAAIMAAVPIAREIACIRIQKNCKKCLTRAKRCGIIRTVKKGANKNERVF
jgi:hypothetical protein